MAASFDDPLSANASAETTIASSSSAGPASSSSSSSTSSPTIGRLTSRRATDHHAGTISGRTVSAIESKAGQHYFDLKALQAQLSEEKAATIRSRPSAGSAIGSTSNGGGSNRRDSSPTQTLQVRAQSRVGQRLADLHADRDDGGSRSIAGSRSRSIPGSARGDEPDEDSGDDASSVGATREEDGEDDDEFPGALTPKSTRSPSLYQGRIRSHLKAPKPIRPGQRSVDKPRNHRLTGAHPRQNSLASLWIQSQGQEQEQDRLGDTRDSQGDDEEEDGFLSRLHLMTDEEIQSFMGATIRAKRMTRATSPFGAGSQATLRPLLATLQSANEVAHQDRQLQHALSSPELPSEARLHPPPDVFTASTRHSDDATLEVCRKLSRALAKSIETASNLRSALEEQAVEAQRKLEAQARKYEAREAAIKTVCGQHGVSAGTIDRAVARALADMPQVSIDVQQQARARRALSPVPGADEPSAASRRKSVAPAAAPPPVPADRHSRYIQAFPESEHSLGFSLQEAMLEDIDSGYGEGAGARVSRSRRSGSASSSKPYPASTISSRPGADSIHATPKSKTRSPSSRSRSQSKVSVTSAITLPPGPPHTPRRPSTKAAESLMPWSVTDSDRKASATTKATTPAAVEADGYLSDSRSISGRTAASVSPLVDRGGSSFFNQVVDDNDTPSLSSVSRRPSMSSARRPSTTSVYNSGTLKAAPSSSASNTSSAFGFFSSLAWRRKKSTPASMSSSVLRQPDDSAGTIRTSSMPVTSPTSSAISTTFTAHSPTDGRSGSGLSLKRTTSPSQKSVSSQVQRQWEGSRPIINQGDRTVSGRDVISALHEAIGSAPVSPSEHPAHVIDLKLLPKPTHLKAVFLATRILGADSSSVLVHSGKETSQLVSQLTFNLVATARDEGLNVSEPTRPSGQSVNRTRRGTLPGQQQGNRIPEVNVSPTSLGPMRHQRMANPRARPQSMAVQAATAVVQAAAAAAAAGSTSATVGRKGHAAKSKGTQATQRKTTVEPNVTRLPLYFGLSQGYVSSDAPPNASSTARPHGQDSSATHSPDTEGTASGPAPPVELEPIVPLDGKPPSLAIFSRQRFRPTPSRRKAGNGPRRMRSIIDKEAQDEYDDSRDTESSGDEFEVYGGKGNIILPTPIHSASTYAANSADTTTSSSVGHSEVAPGYDDRAVDVFGFVYDATPADVRLLRQARLASTPAPACLTGIRVGVAARGGSSDSSDNEDEDEDDSARLATDEETMTLNGGDAEKGGEDDAGDIESHSPSASKISLSKSPHPMGLLGLDKARPSTEASQLSASCVIGLESEGPTSPTQEQDFKLGSSGIHLDTAASDTIRKTPKPKTNSETVRSLLDQLKVMHSRHQAEQMEKWDAFIQHRRMVLAQHRSNAYPHQADGSDGGAGERKRSTGASGSHPVMASESSAANGDDQYHYGLIGLQQMGEDKASRDDYKQFLKLCQEGIPLAHRPKVWAECSGANEMAEPGKYQDLLDEHAGETNQALSQIDLDIHRTMPTNIYFGGDGPGVPKLRRVLAAYSWYNPEIGYCQGMNNLAATLLLTHATEEEAFWVLVCIIEKILPPEYFSSHLLTSQADQRVLIELVHEILPRLAEHLDELGVDLPAVTFAWFLSLYTDCLPVETLFHVWDVFFTEGSIVLFRIALAILIMNEDALLATSSPAAFYGHVHSMTSRLFSVDRLVAIACHDLVAAVTVDKVEGKRARHVAGIKGELGLD